MSYAIDSDITDCMAYVICQDNDVTDDTAYVIWHSSYQLLFYTTGKMLSKRTPYQPHCVTPFFMGHEKTLLFFQDFGVTFPCNFRVMGPESMKINVKISVRLPKACILHRNHKKTRQKLGLHGNLFYTESVRRDD